MTENEVTFKPGEILPDDYPVYGDYFYFADDRLIRSYVFGDVSDLKRDLKSQGLVFENIYAARYGG